MEESRHRKKTETEVQWCYTKRHEGKWSTERCSTRPENMENENSDVLTQNREKAEE